MRLYLRNHRRCLSQGQSSLHRWWFSNRFPKSDTKADQMREALESAELLTLIDQTSSSSSSSLVEAAHLHLSQLPQVHDFVARASFLIYTSPTVLIVLTQVCWFHALMSSFDASQWFSCLRWTHLMMCICLSMLRSSNNMLLAHRCVLLWRFSFCCTVDKSLQVRSLGFHPLCADPHMTCWPSVSWWLTSYTWQRL